MNILINYLGDSMFIMFTGQGSQYVGMGSGWLHFSEMSETMEEMNATLGFDLKKIMLEGSAEDLRLTENAQPAIVCIAVGIWRILKNRFELSPRFLAGHSVGEYAALHVADAISWQDTVRLVNIRGKAMQEASPLGYGGMAAILGVEAKLVGQVLGNSGLQCYVSNDNGGGQVVISGEKDDLGKAIVMLKEAGAARAVELDVSAPFHTPLISSAEVALRSILANTNVNMPKYKVISNVTVKAYENPEDVRALLAKQVTSPVRWRETVEYVASQEVYNAVEIGPSPVLAKLAGRINKDIKAISITSEEDLKKIEAMLTN